MSVNWTQVNREEDEIYAEYERGEITYKQMRVALRDLETDWKEIIEIEKQDYLRGVHDPFGGSW